MGRSYDVDSSGSGLVTASCQYGDEPLVSIDV